MKKNLKILIPLLFLSVFTHAQDTMVNLKNTIHSYYRNLDTSLLQTKILYDRTIPFSSIWRHYGDTSNVDDTLITYDNWLQIALEMSVASYQPDEITPILEINDAVDTLGRHGIIPIGIINYRFDKLKPYALDSQLISWDSTSESYFDFPSNTVSPYFTGYTFAALPLTTGMSINTPVTFVMSPDFYFDNVPAGLTAIRVDFGDGYGFRSMDWGDSVQITYTTVGENDLTFSLEFF